MVEKTNVDEEVLEDNPTSDEPGTDPAEGGEESEIEMGSDPEGDDAGDEGGDFDVEKGREARKERAEAQIARLKEENKRLKEDKRKAERDGKVGASSGDMMAKAYLAATHDIKESDAQDEAIRLADKFEMSVDELMEDSDYRDRIRNVQKQVVQRRKVASGTGGSAQRKKDAAYVADFFQKNGSWPQGTSLDLQYQATEIISGKDKPRWQRV